VHKSFRARNCALCQTDVNQLPQTLRRFSDAWHATVEEEGTTSTAAIQTSILHNVGIQRASYNCHLNELRNQYPAAFAVLPTKRGICHLKLKY